MPALNAFIPHTDRVNFLLLASKVEVRAKGTTLLSEVVFADRHAYNGSVVYKAHQPETVAR
jgi:hypothetical protein